MTAVRLEAPAPSLGERAAWAVRDTLTLTKRELLLWIRVPAYIMFTVIQPVMFVLIFRYVFGGAIPVKVPGGYVSYLMPGIIGQSAAFASFSTAIALARQSQLGVIDRFRAMPMARGAVLGGRLCADAVRMMITILVIIAVGYAVGFRFQNGVVGAIGMVLMAEAFGLAVCCVSGAIGLAIRDEESVQAFGLIWLFPLTFVSSAFVPVQSMPAALRAFANHQPVTFVIDSMRALALGGPLEPHLWEAIVSIVGIFVLFGPLAVRVYKRAG